MQKRTNNNSNNNSDYKKADGFLNVVIEIKDANGNWHPIKPGALDAEKAVHRAIMAKPEVLEDPDRVRVSNLSVHVVTDESKEIEF